MPRFEPNGQQGEDLLYNSPTTSSSTNNAILGGKTWQDVKDQYREVKWTALVNNIVFGGIIPLDLLEDGRPLSAAFNPTLHFAIRPNGMSANTFTFAITNHLANAQELKLWGVR